MCLWDLTSHPLTGPGLHSTELYYIVLDRIKLNCTTLYCVRLCLYWTLNFTAPHCLELLDLTLLGPPWRILAIPEETNHSSPHASYTLSSTGETNHFSPNFHTHFNFQLKQIIPSPISPPHSLVHLSPIIPPRQLLNKSEGKSDEILILDGVGPIDNRHSTD